jgi:hypothetical protein
MIFPRAALILLPCPVVAVLCTSFVDVRALPCLPSASAVRQEYPGAWPSWTMRTKGHEGEKCWYPATRATAHDHRKEIAPDDEAIEIPQPQSTPQARTRNSMPTSLALLRNATTISTLIPEESSFADRFAAVSEDSGPSSIMRFMIDPIGNELARQKLMGFAPLNPSYGGAP